MATLHSYRLMAKNGAVEVLPELEPNAAEQTARPKHYEELPGAENRQIFFRADRHVARNMFGELAPTALIDDERLEVNDFSMSGLSVFAKPEHEEICEIGAELPIEIGVGGKMLHQGVGRVIRVEPTPFRTMVALEFSGGFLDVAKLIDHCRGEALRRKLERTTAPDHSGVPLDYRAHCADTLHFLSELRNELQSFEADLGMVSAENRDAEFLKLCEEIVLPKWRELWHRGNEIAVGLMGDRHAMAAAKRYTEKVVTPAFMPGLIWRHSFEKPRGYPGDFELMRRVYDWDVQGETLHDKMLYLIGLDVAECIATRMDMMSKIIGTVVSEKADGKPVRVLSLGCGPAQEVVNYLEAPNESRAVRFTLIDQDHDALASVHRRCYPHVARLAIDTAINCLEMSFKRLLSGDDAFESLPAQDVIYSMGLVDYLTPRRARQLVEALYAKLSSGGRLVIGNMSDAATGNQWPMEFLCDWTVQYRSRNDMLAMAAELPSAKIELAPDPTGRVYVLTVHKP